MRYNIAMFGPAKDLGLKCRGCQGALYLSFG
jgi:hypothetical protein